MSMLQAAYSFYNVSTATPWVELMGDALVCLLPLLLLLFLLLSFSYHSSPSPPPPQVLAKRENFDVFNALDLMENSEFLEKLKFGIGDGNLQVPFLPLFSFSPHSPP